MNFDWLFIKVYDHWIKQEHYQVHRYFVPRSLAVRINFLQKYFRYMDSEGIPYKDKFRKNSEEFAETALMMLGRIHSLNKKKIPVVVGSGFLSPKPWAIFGDVDEKVAHFKFKTIYDIANFYKPKILGGDSYGAHFHFRLYPNLVSELSSETNLTSHYIVSMAICLLYDMIINSGPDCIDFYELYTNDSQLKPEHIDINWWQRLRCKVMGVHGKIRYTKWNVKVGQYYKPRVTLKSSLKFHEISNSNNLELGEKIIKITKNSDNCLSGRCDDFIDAPETDLEYQKRVKDVVEKHKNLINPTWCQ